MSRTTAMVWPMPVKFDDLEVAVDFVSADGGMTEFAAYLCLQTGQIYYDDAGFSGEDVTLPDDIEDAKKYIPVPSTRDLDLGRPLVFDFVNEFMPDDYDFVRDIFSRRGAYGQFKNFLARKRKLDQWHAFENEAQKKAIREWCADNGIEVEE